MFVNFFHSTKMRRVMTPGIVQPDSNSVHYWRWQQDGNPSWLFTLLDH